jgi:circadian clock protein KaiC
MGQPGTGKTVFAERLVFHNAAEGRPILYLTTLSEPLAKVVKYLQRFDFYDEAKLGTSVHYDDLGPALAERGIAALLPAITEAIKTVAPKILVIDSFKAIHDLSPSVAEMRRMLYELTGVLTAYDTTVFLLGEYTGEHSRQLPEFAISDGIVEFLRSPTSARDERFLRVLKLRGSSYMEGQHGFRIGRGGLEVFPRLVSPVVPETYRIPDEKVSWGVPGLDALLGGGLWRGSTTLLAGSTGAGKTTMGLQFVLEGLRLGEPSLFVNFQENPTQLARAFSNLGADVADARKRGLHLFYSSPVELQIDSVIVSTFRKIRQESIRRVVIDAVGDLMTAASDPQRVHDYLYALVQHFAVMGVTCVLNFETKGGLTGSDSDVGGRFSFMSDNIVVLGLTPPNRTVSVMKARASAHDLGVHVLEITAKGAAVRPRV